MPPGNEHKLTEATARLLDDGDLRARLAAGAHERVQRFTASAVASALKPFTRRSLRGILKRPRTAGANADGRDADTLWS